MVCRKLWNLRLDRSKKSWHLRPLDPLIWAFFCPILRVFTVHLFPCFIWGVQNLLKVDCADRDSVAQFMFILRPSIYNATRKVDCSLPGLHKLDTSDSAEQFTRTFYKIRQADFMPFLACIKCLYDSCLTSGKALLDVHQELILTIRIFW